MKTLKITEFGNPVLRLTANKIAPVDITSDAVQQLIGEMKLVLAAKDLGVGLAAPQVGVSLAVSVIAIRPSERRPDAELVDLVIINPDVVQTFGYRKQLYEGCISGGPGRASLFARVPRYHKLKLAYYDEMGERQLRVFEGLTAHVIQHEVDHLNGVLFVDRVRDTKSYITYKEYVKLVSTTAKSPR